MIHICPSPTADTRTCDYAAVTKKQLRESSIQHIRDVRDGFYFLIERLQVAAECHDYDKLTELAWFRRDFITGFKKTGWWDNHRQVNRHHLAQADGAREDVNLIDVLEYIVDCVMAGMARSGTVTPVDIDPDVLLKAFQNTVELLKSQVVVDKLQGETP